MHAFMTPDHDLDGRPSVTPKECGAYPLIYTDGGEAIRVECARCLTLPSSSPRWWISSETAKPHFAHCNATRTANMPARCSTHAIAECYATLTTLPVTTRITLSAMHPPAASSRHATMARTRVPNGRKHYCFFTPNEPM